MIRINDIIKSMGSHNLLATPTAAAFQDPRLGPLLQKYLPGANGISAQERARIMRTAWDFAGSALGNRIELYERFYLGSIGRARALDHRKAQAAGETGAYRALFDEIDAAAPDPGPRRRRARVRPRRRRQPRRAWTCSPSGPGPRNPAMTAQTTGATTVQTITETVSRHIAGTGYEAFDAGTVARAKIRIIDSLGNIAAGRRAQGNDALLALATCWGGAAESTVLAHGARIPAHNAAMVNAVMMRSYDFEAIGAEYEDHTQTAAHISGTTVPVALAVAEQQRSSGRELLTALILGDDLTPGSAPRPASMCTAARTTRAPSTASAAPPSPRS